MRVARRLSNLLGLAALVLGLCGADCEPGMPTWRDEVTDEVRVPVMEGDTSPEVRLAVIVETRGCAPDCAATVRVDGSFLGATGSVRLVPDDPDSPPFVLAEATMVGSTSTIALPGPWLQGVDVNDCAIAPCRVGFAIQVMGRPGDEAVASVSVEMVGLGDGPFPRRPDGVDARVVFE